MARQTPDAPLPAGNSGGGMHRRDFLHLSVLGLAARPGASAPGAPAPSPQQAQPELPPGWIDPARLPVETWLEPWTWRPEDWPERALQLNVVQHGNPGPSPSPGNAGPSLFSYGGISPGPTIRMRGDGVLRLTVRNLLGLNHGRTPIGPHPDPIEMTPALFERVCRRIAARQGRGDEENPQCGFFDPFFNPDAVFEALPVRTLPAYAVIGHLNGQHAAHVTNIHVHGLHVEPVRNPDGTPSDDLFLRILSKADWEARKRDGLPNTTRLAPNEHVGEITYTFRLGDVLRDRRIRTGGTPQPQPPGTHWYHPHAHGSTHDQVSSGMAGFLILEGDVDEAINRAMTGEARPDPELKSGPYDYRERLIFLQRVLVQSVDLNAGERRRQLVEPPVPAIGGAQRPRVLFMRPGAVERWRTLNGSVDGRGFKRLMVLKGEYIHRRDTELPGTNRGHLFRIIRGAEGEEPRLEAVSRQEIEDAKLPLYHLATDGITLVTVEDGRPKYTIKDLSTRNAGTLNPLNRPIGANENLYDGLLRNYEDCFRDGDALRRCFNRPNEVYLGPANRADLFFKAPLDSSGEVFTVFAQETLVHTDHYQSRLQVSRARGEDRFRVSPVDVVLAYVHVRGEPVEGGDFDVMGLRDVLPDVPPFLYPIEEEELRVTPQEARARAIPEDSFRTRVVSYSGWGSTDYPLIEVPDAFAEAHPELKDLVWTEHEGIRVLLANGTRTMGINGRFDLAVEPDPPPPKKFAHNDPDRVKVLVDTAEEWTLYNTSIMLWSYRDTEAHPQPGQYASHYRACPLSRKDGQARSARDPGFQITTKGADHPFHIHVNPCWVLRIEVPDENDRLHNILDEPCWMDTVPIPRNGGRVVFRSRFPTFTGHWVNHCHLLMHEDNGMMQVVEAVEDPRKVNYNPRTRLAPFDASEADVNAVYPRPSLDLCYTQSVGFVDPNPESGQVYPGFPVAPPRPDDLSPKSP